MLNLLIPWQQWQRVNPGWSLSKYLSQGSFQDRVFKRTSCRSEEQSRASTWLRKSPSCMVGVPRQASAFTNRMRLWASTMQTKLSNTRVIMLQALMVRLYCQTSLPNLRGDTRESLTKATSMPPGIRYSATSMNQSTVELLNVRILILSYTFLDHQWKPCDKKRPNDQVWVYIIIYKLKNLNLIKVT